MMKLIESLTEKLKKEARGGDAVAQDEIPEEDEQTKKKKKKKRVENE